MKLHNTLTRQTEEFTPIKIGEAKLYTCGPTVYSYYHIGNMRNAVFNDTLRRALAAEGLEVKHVMNITDVGHLTSDSDEGDDKLEKGAIAEGKTVWEVAEFYTKAFKRDLKALNVLEPNGYKGKDDNYARATDFIDQQLDLVSNLLDKNYAYQTKQAIYFDTSKLDDYGELTGQKLSEKEVAARPEVITDTDKRNPQDFAVWFFTAGHFEGHTMRWPSPWGEGFPGWHLECSAIIHATLGDPIDIHTGAVDLIGTHHTNEIAQTEAAYGNKLANYWVHNEYVLIEGRKMSKSLGNIYNLDDVKKKGYSPMALRLLFLQAHYRSQMNFTWDSLAAAQQFLNRLYAWADLKFQATAFTNDSGSNYQDVISGMKQVMANDLNSAEALAILSARAAQDEERGISGGNFQELLEEIDSLLGLGISTRNDISQDIKQLLAQREQTRQDSDWPKSDEIRQQLAEKGIEVLDTNRGQLWRRSS
jgi:cysteinyl-tRNA synthetase